MQPLTIKAGRDIERMRTVCRLASDVLDFIAPYVRPGVSTDCLDRLCHAYMVNEQVARPAYLHYAPPGHAPYPKSIFTSVNRQVCHGIPGDYVLQDGDIINIAAGVAKDGFHASASRMFHAGGSSPVGRRVSEVALECTQAGIARVRPGVPLSEIGAAIEAHAQRQGMSVVREFCGHGIGKSMLEMPYVPYVAYAQHDAGRMLVPGMTLTIGPMINSGRRYVRVLADGWTIVTQDYGLSAQWEHTVLVTGNGFEVLTLPACGGIEHFASGLHRAVLASAFDFKARQPDHFPDSAASLFTGDQSR